MDNPYTIPAGKTVMFGVKYEYGRNLNFAAICDRTPSNGKGNLYSYDGKTWIADGRAISSSRRTSKTRGKKNQQDTW